LLGKQVFEAGLGSINEIFDGEPPHMPRGCIAQAWSVAEPLRAYVEDFMQIKPRHEKDVLENLG
jgi:glycogen debranching enzyme